MNAELRRRAGGASAATVTNVGNRAIAARDACLVHVGASVRRAALSARAGSAAFAQVDASVTTCRAAATACRAAAARSAVVPAAATAGGRIG